MSSVTNNTSLVLTNYATTSLSAINYKTTSANVTGTGTNFTGELAAGDRIFNSVNLYIGTIATITNSTLLTVNATDAVTSTSISYKGSSATVTGTGTNFTTLSSGDLLISNNITLGIISSVTNSTSLILAAKAGAAISGQTFKATPGTITFGLFYAGTSVYLNTWYDQSGNGRDAIQLKSGNQARIVNAGVLYSIGGRTSIEFSPSLASFLQTTTTASFLNNSPYTINKVAAEGSINPSNQFPISTTGGGGPTNTVSHFGYRSSALLTLAQLGHDHNFNATPGISLESRTAVKISAAASQMYKNGVSLGVVNNGVASYLTDVGLLNIGYYLPANVFYSGSISEAVIFPSALNTGDLSLLNNNQVAYYNLSTFFWTGAVSTDWNNAGNWSTGIIPTLNSPSIALIPSGKPFYPIINTGTIQANSISIEAGASLIVNGTGILQLAGTINNLGTANFTSGTIEYIGTAPQGIGANTFTGNLLNLTINNTTGVQLNGDISVSGNLTFTSGKLSIYVAKLTLGGVVTNTVSGGLKGESNSSIVINGSVSPTLSFDQTSPGGTNILKNLSINSPGQTVILANNLVLLSTGTTTFTAGKLSIASATLTIRGAVVNTVNEGLSGSLSAKVIVDGTVSSTLSFDQTTPGVTNALSSLTLNCTGQTITLNRNLAIVSTLTLSAGRLADGGNQITSNGTLDLVAGIFRLGSATVATAWPTFTINNISVGGTVDYGSGVSRIVVGIPTYQNLIVSATGGTIAGNDLRVNGLLNLSAANPSGNCFDNYLWEISHFISGGSRSFTAGQGDVTGIVKRTTILPNISYTMGNEFSSITFPNTGTLPSQMSMKISIGVGPTWLPGALLRTYDFIQTGGANPKAVINAHYLDAELNGNNENTLVDFSYRYSGAIFTEHGKSNFNTTQNWIALSNVNVAFFSSIFGTVELSFDETALVTLTWNGSTSTSWITATNWTPNGGPSTNTVLIIPDASTTPNDPSLPATASNGSLTIQSGGIVNADPGSQFTLNNSGLAWSNSGTFNASTGTIFFTNSNATLNGTTNFSNVTINSGATLLISSGSVMRISGLMTNNGVWSTGLLENTVEYNGNNQTVVIPNGATQSYYNLIISGTGTTVFPAASINLFGSLTINSAISTSGNTISMNGIRAQIIHGNIPLTLNNLIINNNSFPVTLTQGLAVFGTLTFTSGKLAIGSNTLTLTGNLINTVPNGLSGGSTSNVIVNGAVSPILSFDQTTASVTNVLHDLMISSSGQVPALGSDLEVDGTMTLTAGKLAISNNTLTLKGAVINTVPGALRGSSGSNIVIAGGTVSPVLSFDQTTTGTTNRINNFSINNTGNSVTLNSPLILGGSLALMDGLINTTAVNSLTLTATANYTGGSNVSFVNGPLIRNTISATSYDFPVGKINYYRPVTITPSTAAAGNYGAEFFPLTPPVGTYNAGLTGIATNEYWDISRSSGPDANVTLIYTGDNTWTAGSPSSQDNIFVAHLAVGTWYPVYGDVIPGNTGTGMTTLTSSILTSFSPFTFGYSLNATLPVTLLSFKAIGVKESIELIWKTDNEYSFSRFEVQRSSDGLNFDKLGSVLATNLSSVATYRWVDDAPLGGSNYYRLKMIDIDGDFKYSITSSVERKGRKSLVVYPNPVTGGLIKLQWRNQPKGQYRINLYDTYGKVIQSGSLTHDGQNTTTSVRLNRNLPFGFYYLEINDPSSRKQSFKISIR